MNPVKREMISQDREGRQVGTHSTTQQLSRAHKRLLLSHTEERNLKLKPAAGTSDTRGIFTPSNSVRHIYHNYISRLLFLSFLAQTRQKVMQNKKHWWCSWWFWR